MATGKKPYHGSTFSSSVSYSTPTIAISLGPFVTKKPSHNLIMQDHIKNIAKGTTDPRVEFILPK